MPTPKLTTEILTAALEGFTQQRHRLDSQIAELRAMISGDANATASVSPSQVIAKTAANPAKVNHVKRTLSAAGRRNIIEATKRRWALKRAEEAKSQAVTEKAPINKAASKKAAVNKTGAK
jgi:hypothetical protein